MKNQNTKKTGIGTPNCINLQRKIHDTINFASHCFDMKNYADGNFYLNVAKFLIADITNTEIWVSNEYINNIEKKVSDLK